jgi:hypothetical protein
MNFEGVGRFIYGAQRLGAGPMDLENWMADDLGVARPEPDDESANGKLFTAFFAKYDCSEKLQENFGRFVEMLQSRS